MQFLRAPSAVSRPPVPAAMANHFFWRELFEMEELAREN
jgi:hypothetical protein